VFHRAYSRCLECGTRCSDGDLWREKQWRRGWITSHKRFVSTPVVLLPGKEAHILTMESFGPIGGRIGRVFVIDASSFIRLQKFVMIVRKVTPTIPILWTHIVMRNSNTGTVNIIASFAIFVEQCKDYFC